VKSLPFAEGKGYLNFFKRPKPYSSELRWQMLAVFSGNLIFPILRDREK
jgi:hypothetical protein